MPKIQKIEAREILDSRGWPTVEVELQLDTGLSARAAVPSGASTGQHEAHELRDKDSSRYLGKGVRLATENVRHILGPALVGVDVSQQSKIDEILCEKDGTENKSKLGANAILGVSLAAAKAHALAQKMWLFESLAQTEKQSSFKIPVPLMNVINGGAHANNGLDVQEFMIAPVAGGSFSEALRMAAEVFHQLKKTLSDKNLSTAVGDEGGFAPTLRSNREALELIVTAIEKAGYKAGEQILLALDVAATELYIEEKDSERFYKWENKKISHSQLADIYTQWCKDFPIQSIEDAFSEDDWSSWVDFQKSMASRLQLVGDDLFVTNPRRLQNGIELKAANSILVKVNQIGTLSETRKAVEMAQKAQFHTVMSHRSGETEDTTIADLAVGLGSQQIKTGSLCRAERTAKYNQLLRIEGYLGARAEFWGPQAFQF